MSAAKKPCRLELNNSGAWKLLGNFDLTDEISADIIMESAAALAASLNAAAATTGRGRMTLRISTDESVPATLARWANSDDGWRDARTGEAL